MSTSSAPASRAMICPSPYSSLGAVVMLNTLIAPPVARMTALASMLRYSPVAISTAKAPLMRPPSFDRAMAWQLSMVAICLSRT